MNTELGSILKTLRSPEKSYAQAPIWKDILFNLIPSAIVAFMMRALLLGAGLEEFTVNLLFVLVTAFFTFFCVFTTRSVKKRCAELFLNIHENGLSGVRLVNAFKTKSFELPFSELKDVTWAKARLILSTSSGKIMMTLDDAEAVAAELKQRLA